MGSEIFGVLFFQKMPFLPNIGRHNFLEYTLH